MKLVATLLLISLGCGLGYAAYLTSSSPFCIVLGLLCAVALMEGIDGLSKLGGISK